MSTFYVPAMFWDDYSERCPIDNESDMAIEIERAGKRVLIQANETQVKCLHGDAVFYAKGNVDDCASLVRSAKATVAAIAKHSGYSL